MTWPDHLSSPIRPLDPQSPWHTHYRHSAIRASPGSASPAWSSPLLTGIPSNPLLAHPQIQLEALASLLIFLPGIVLAAKPLEEVTWRAEMAKRWVVGRGNRGEHSLNSTRRSCYSAHEDSDARIAFIPLGPAYRQVGAAGGQGEGGE